MSFDQESRIIECPNVSNLAWDGGVLIEVTTGRRISLDGGVSSGTFFTPYSFDRSICLRNDNTLWSVAYDNRGTKALLFKNWKEQRELNRSYYFAERYDYPIALARVADGRVVVIHCPNSFNTVELEDAESGEVLWTRKTDNMEFHSRLAVSDDGRFLLSAGWFWHPVGGAWLCPVSFGSQIGSAKEVGFSFGAEIDGAAFLDEDHIVISSTDEVINEDISGSSIGPMQLGVWSISEGRWISTVPISTVTGTIMPWNKWVISFYEHPKVIELATGRIVHTWAEIDSGHQIGSIEIGTPPPPVLAFNQSKGMFALADSKGIRVISLRDSAEDFLA